MARVIPFDDLRSGGAHEFEGEPFGSEVTFIIVDTEEPGAGPKLHQHPYTETFIVLEGNALFQVGEEQLRVSGGSVVVVPANTPHRFENIGPGRLRQIDIHAAPRFQTEWLAE